MIRPKSSGPFKLDENFINDIEDGWVRSERWEKGRALDVNTEFLHSPLRSCEVNGVSYPADRLQHLISTAPAHLTPSGHVLTFVSPQRTMPISSAPTTAK